MTDSLIFYIHKNKKIPSYSKANNKIYGYYRDSILNDFVYLASNGLNITNFRRKLLQPESFNPSSYKFISYFSSLEDNFLRLNIYPQKYSYKSLKNYLKKKRLFSNWEERRKKKWPASKFLYFFPVFIKNYQRYRQLRYLLNNFVTSSRLRFYKNKGYRFFLSKPTRTIQDSNKFIYRIWFFRFISRFIPAPIRISFMPVMKLGYLIIRHLSRIFSDKSVSFASFYNILVYNYYFRFVQNIFRKGMFYNKFEKKGLRNSNGIVFHYFTVLEKKLVSLTTFISKIIKEKLSNNYLYNWINFFLYGKVLFSSSVKVTEEHDIKNLVNFLPANVKLDILTTLINKAILYTTNKLSNLNTGYLTSVYEYLVLKSFSFSVFTKNHFYFTKILKEFDFKTINFYTYNLINLKINNFIKTYHGRERKSFSFGMLRGSSLNTKLFKQKVKTLSKVYFKYKYLSKIFLFKPFIRKFKKFRTSVKFSKFFKFFRRLNFKSKKLFFRKFWWNTHRRFIEFKDYRAFSKRLSKLLTLRLLSLRKAWCWKTWPIWNKNRWARSKAWKINVYRQIRRLKFRSIPFLRNKAWIVYWLFKYKNRGELRTWKRLKGYREKWWKFVISKRFAAKTSFRKFSKVIRRKLKFKKINVLKLFLKFRPYFANQRKIPKKLSLFKVFKEIRRIKRFLRFKEKLYYPYAVARRMHWKFKEPRKLNYTKLALIKYKLKYSNKPHKHIKLNVKSRYIKDPNIKLMFSIGLDPEKKKKHKYKGFKSRFNFKSKNKNFKKQWKNKKKVFGPNKPFFQKQKNFNKKQKNFNKSKKKFYYGTNRK